MDGISQKMLESKDVSDGDGYVGEEKERKTEVEVDGQHETLLDREGIIR